MRSADQAVPDQQETPWVCRVESRNRALGRRRVFFLVDSLNVGGTETQAVELARRLDPAEYEVTLGCLKAQGPLLERLQGSAVSVVEFYPNGGMDSIGGVRQVLRLAAFLRRERFEVVHTHDLRSNLMGVPAARLARIPVVISSRRDLSQFDWYKAHRRVWLRWIQNLSNVVLTNASCIRDGLITEDGFAPEKIRVIHNGVDTDSIRAATRDRDRLFPGVGEGKLIVLVGNMHSDAKGHPWLIAAAPAIVQEFRTARFVCAGDGEQRKEFERRVAELGLQQNFLFLGHRKDIPEILACCDIAVLPSRAGGLPNAVLEYLAAGLPTVASEVGGNAEILQDGVTGLLVPPEDSEALSAASRRLMRDPALASRLAKNGRDYVQHNFSFERLIREVDSLYTELLGRSGSTKKYFMLPGQSWQEWRWKGGVARLAAMDRKELLDRARQQLSARVDGLRYRFGLDFASEVQDGKLARQSRFFFLPEEAESICALLKQRFSKQVDEIVQRAERICRHRFDLLGYEDIDYGTEIDWHSDRVHGRQAPRKPWYQIHYLNFGQVGDSKITWELNRHQHWVTLAKAYRLTGEERFAIEIFRQWRHWHTENPYPIGVNWASSLEVGFRSISWLWTYFLLSDSPGVPSGFRSDWLRALGISGRHIERYLSTYFSPNTHLLGEGVTLFFIGVLCPELPSAARWRQRGWEIVLHQAERQVQADGLHFEQSTYYHVYALDFFLHAAVLASVNEIPIPKEFEQALEKMLDALCLLSRAGPPPSLGDDDGGRLFDPRRNLGEHMLDPLATGAVLFGRGDFKLVSGGVQEETLWLLGLQGIAEFDRLPEKSPDQRSVPLRAGGLYLMASESGQQLVVDAGPQGIGNAGHGHADALNICLNSKGRPLLIDPGTFEYVGNDRDRDQFRRTSAHNTLQVDGVSQAEPNGPFAWVQPADVRAERWISGERFDLFAGSHDGYTRLEPPVIHCRWVFSLKSRFWLVRDVAIGKGQHRLDLFWHFSPSSNPVQGNNEIFLEKSGPRSLRLRAAEGHGWSREIIEGWWSPVYGRKERAQVARFGTVAELPAEFVTLLIPIERAEEETADLLRIGDSANSRLSGYRYRTSEEEHYIIFAQAGENWWLGTWTSDAEFLYWGLEGGGGLHTLIFCNGSYVEIGGRRIVSSKQRVTWCELAIVNKETRLSSSQRESIVMHEPLDRISLWTSNQCRG